MKRYMPTQGAIGAAQAEQEGELTLAVRWTKRRLLEVFPELRGNSRALEAAYQSLGLETQWGLGGRIFEVQAHREFEN